jgi:hypothetical protein
MKNVKKVVKIINDYTVQIFLFFVYFIAIGLAKIIYIFQDKTGEESNNWNTNIQKHTTKYFSSPY